MLPGQTGSIPRTPYRTGPGEEMLNPGRLSPGWRGSGRDSRHRTRVPDPEKKRGPMPGPLICHHRAMTTSYRATLAAAGAGHVLARKIGRCTSGRCSRGKRGRIRGIAADPDHVVVVAEARLEHQDVAIDLVVRLITVGDYDVALINSDPRNVLARRARRGRGRQCRLYRHQSATSLYRPRIRKPTP